jgi:hypothetical protein
MSLKMLSLAVAWEPPPLTKDANSIQCSPVKQQGVKYFILLTKTRFDLRKKAWRSDSFMFCDFATEAGGRLNDYNVIVVPGQVA